MASIDPNILLQQQPVKIADPLDNYARLQQISGIQNQNALAQQQLSRVNRENSQQDAMAKAYADAFDPATGKVDSTKLLGSLAAAGAGGAIPGAQKSIAEASKAQRDADMANVDHAIKKQNYIAQLVGGVTDDATWNAALQNAAKVGVDVSQLPSTYDPSVIKRLQMQALTGVQQLEQHWKQQGYDLDLRKQDEVERNNKTQNDISKGQLGVSRGQLSVSRDRLNFEKSQPKGVYDKDNAIIVDPRTGRSIAVTGPDGQPMAGGGGKLTEDQGKATGWLIQAENAYKNIQDAIKSTPSALKPGINDAIAAIPSFGLGEAIGNSMRGGDRQRVLQSTSSLSEALLRAATGAGVNRDEAIQKTRELTPVAGDSDAVIAQKMNAIPLYIDSLRVRAGPGAKKADQVLNNRPAPATEGNDGWSVREVK